MSPHLRKDPFSPNWIIFSNNRNARPNDYRAKIKCPFCPENEYLTPPEILSIKKNKKWIIRVVPNKYPALTYNTENYTEHLGLYNLYHYRGAHEVLIESPEHNKNIEDIKHLDKIFEVFSKRIHDLYKLKGIKYVMVFRNYGENAGASLKHPHSQIIALPLLPLRLKHKLNHFVNYYSKNKRCLMCDIVKFEKKQRERVIFENKSFIAITPFASRFNFELWIIPKKHITAYTDFNNYRELSQIFRKVMRKLRNSIKNLSYNLIIHTSPANTRKEHFHWHIEILPKLAMTAGFEWGSGFYINTITPELAATILKKNKKFDFF